MMRLPLLALFLGASVAAQDLTHKAPPQTNPILIENGTIHPVASGVIEGGAILFSNGKIIAIGESSGALDLPDGVERIDATGLQVFPGLIDAHTRLGLEEIGNTRATMDHNEIGDITPEVRTAVAVNPDATAIPVTRSNGILSVGIHPTQGLIPGRISALQLDGWTWESMTVRDEVGLAIGWPGERPAGRFRGFRGGDQGDRPSAAERRKTIDSAFRDAEAYLEARAADASIATDIRKLAMASAVQGTRPVFIQADDVEQIQSSIAWATSMNLAPVIVGGRDAGMCIDLLQRHEVPVMLSGTHRLPARRDSATQEPFALPAELEAAGIEWCLTSGGDYSNVRNLPYQAGKAVAYGLSKEAALRSLTIAPAKILGIDDQLGSLEAGKLATLIVTDGNPMEITTKVSMAFIAGRRIDLSNKQTKLAEKYREKYRQMRLIPGGR